MMRKLAIVICAMIPFLVTACSSPSDEPEYFDESDPELTRAEKFTRRFAGALIDGDIGAAYAMTSPHLRNRQSAEAFEERIHSQFEPFGLPVGFSGFDFEGIGPLEITDDMGFPPDYPQDKRAARTVAVVQTSEGGADLWLSVGVDDTELALVDFEVLPLD